MAQLELNGFKKEEIKNVSGKGISFKKVIIPNEDCSNYFIRYAINNPITKSEFRSLISCVVSPYQREDSSQVKLYKSILIPENCVLNISLESVARSSFTGNATVEYDIFVPAEKLKNKSTMKVFISEKDRQDAFRVALSNLAVFFNIENWEFDNNQTLYNKIKTLNNPIVKYLKEYIISYNKWFEFYARIKVMENKTGNAHELTDDEREELTSLIKDRENTLNTLQLKFDELQFERFKKLNGLENVDGLIL